MKTKEIQMTDQIKEKNRIQKNAVALSKKHRFLCLEWATGCGKTLGAIKIVESILEKNKEARGYLVCKETTHKKNWLDDIKKHGKTKAGDSMKAILYASLKNQKEKANFVLLDECHALTPLRIKALRNILQKGTKIIFLSATIPIEKKQLMNGLCKKVYYNTISLNKAFELGLLPKPSLMVHKVYLSDHIIDGKFWEFKARNPKKKGSNMFKYCSHDRMFQVMKETPKEWGIICSGTEKETYNALTNQMAYYDQLVNDLQIPYKVREGCRFKYLNIASTRKKFISEVKTEKVKSLVKDFRKNNSRFICFTGSIKQSIEIGSKSAVHSKNEDSFNQNLIDCFNSLKCSELFAVKMLREGINLSQIEKGIITQLDSTVGSFFQMLGRCLRHEFPEMHLLVLQETQDVVYFNKSMKNFNQEYITWL